MVEPFTAGSTPVSALVGDKLGCIAPDATLLDLADALAAADVGALVVGDENNVIGVVSERDLVGAIARRLPPETTPVSTVATRELVWCDADAPVADVAMEMAERYVRHVLVEDQGRVVGIVSARDLLGAYAAGDATFE